MVNKSIRRLIMFALILILIFNVFGGIVTVSAQQNQTTYVVRAGDTLRIIAVRFGTTWQAIAVANSLPNPNRIYVGQVLVIPMASPPNQSYVVQRGDTLHIIALRFGITWQAIAEANHLVNPNLIHAGDVLLIPTTGGPIVQPPITTQYVVQPGDTLMRISLRFGIDIWTLARVNKILNLNRIYVGQILIIPS